jgi:hypothetical protein
MSKFILFIQRGSIFILFKQIINERKFNSPNKILSHQRAERKETRFLNTLMSGHVHSHGIPLAVNRDSGINPNILLRLPKEGEIWVGANAN